MARGMVKFRNGLCSVSTFISSVNFPTDPKFFMWKPCEKHLKHLRKIRSLPESFFTSVSSCSWSLRIKRLTFMHALLSLTKPNRKFLTQTGDLRNTDGARKKLTARFFVKQRHNAVHMVILKTAMVVWYQRELYAQKRYLACHSLKFLR